MVRPSPEYSYRKKGFGYSCLTGIVVGVLLTFVTILAKIDDSRLVFFGRTSALVGCVLCLLPVVCSYLWEKDLLVFTTAGATENKQPAGTKYFLEEYNLKVPITLKEVSSNYYSLEGAEQPSETMIPLHDTSEPSDCLVCLSEKSNMIGIPCGHLTTCQPCMKYYVEMNNSKCLICKQEMKEVYRTERTKSPGEVSVKAAYMISVK